MGPGGMIGREQEFAKGFLLVLAATVGWSLAGLFVRFLPGLTGWQINCWRGFFTSLALALYMVIAHRGQAWARVREIPTLALWSSAIFFTLGSTSYVTALTYTSTANVSCIASLSPIMTALMSRFLTGERAGPAAWLAALLAVAGVGVIMKDGIDAGHWLGNVFALSVALNFSLQTMLLRRYSHFEMVPAICLGGLLVFVVASLLGHGLEVSWPAIGVLAMMGPIQLALPLILYARGARYVPAVMLNLISLLDVVLNPFWTWLGAGEVPPLMTFVGGGLIALAIAVAILGRPRPAA